jgi:hypothetical protein
MKRTALSLATTTTLLSTTAMFAGCAFSSIVLTDGRQEARAAADADQRVADTYRRAGAPEAAKPAQKRADAGYADANNKYEGILEWVLDLIFHTWLYSGK